MENNEKLDRQNDIMQSKIILIFLVVNVKECFIFFGQPSNEDLENIQMHLFTSTRVVLDLRPLFFYHSFKFATQRPCSK